MSDRRGVSEPCVAAPRGQPWLPYVAMFGSRFREELQYRAAALAGLATQVVFGFIIIMVLLAFYESSDVPAPMDIPQTLVYVWLAQALLGLLPWNVDPGVANAIRTGEVVQELLRPVDTFRLWFARVLAWRVVRTTLRSVPMLVLAMAVFPRIGFAKFTMPLPASWSGLGLFALAVLLAAVLSTVITLLIQVAMLWTVSPDGVLRVVPGFVIVLSGSLLPLPLLPAWLQPFLERQPFRGLIDTPSRLYGGELVGDAAWAALGWSAIWIVVLAVVAQWTLRRGLNRLAVAGG